MRECKRCLELKDISFFYNKKGGKDGLNAWCKECVKIDNNSRKGKYDDKQKDYRKTYSQKPEVKERRHQQYLRDKDKIRLRTGQYYWSLQGQINQYKKSARKRNIIWDLSKEETEKFYNTTCTYCGDLYKGLGIDRVNNDKGYIIDNCVSCCYICNIMKRTQTKEEFILKIKKIWENIGK